MDESVQRQPGAPPRCFQVGPPRKLGHIAEAEVGEHRDRLRNAQHAFQGGMVHDADPPDPDSFGPRRQPQILNRTTGTVEVGVPHGGTSKHRSASPPAVAGHAEIHRRLLDAFELETPIEVGARPFILHRRLIIDSVKDRLHGAFGRSVTHHHKVPGLHEADRPSMVSRSQQSRQHVIRYRGR